MIRDVLPYPDRPAPCRPSQPTDECQDCPRALDWHPLMGGRTHPREVVIDASSLFGPGKFWSACPMR